MARTFLNSLAVVVLLGAARLSAASAPTAAIENDIAELSKRTEGVVGVAAWRLDGQGPRVLVNADQRYPMASTYKVAIAGAIFAAVDAGRLKLDQMVTVDPAVMVPSEVLADRFIHPGVSLSVYNLLELMLTQSDNTATDVLMKLAGGGSAVTAWVKKQGVQGLQVDRDTGALLREFFGMPADGTFTEALAAAEKADPKLEEKGALPNPAFDDDVRDTATPTAMSELLTRIFSGHALSAASTKALIGIMERCRTGDARLKGRLPPGTPLAHKTGTIGGSINDVGVMTLPAGRGQVVVTVFIKKSAVPFEQREAVIAEIARSVRDYYLFAVP
jgi:beta-lactamase class A